MTSRRGYDSQPDAPTSLSDPYRIWSPPQQPDSDRFRSKLASYDQPSRSSRPEEQNKHRSSSRTHRHDRPTASSSYPQVPTSSTKGHRYFNHPTAASITQPAAPLSTLHPSSSTNAYNSSRSHTQRPQQEAYDPSTHVQKRVATTPTPQSSYERPFGNDENSKTSHPNYAPSLNHIAAAPAHQPSASWAPPPQVASSSSQRQKGAENSESDTDRAKEKRRETNRERKEGRDKTAERSRDKSRTREREPGQEIYPTENKDSAKEAALYREQRSKPSSREVRELRWQDPDSSDSVATPSGHRRYRSEEGVTSTVRRHRRDASQPITSTRQTPAQVSHPSALSHIPAQFGNPPQAMGPADGKEQDLPPTPHAMPVYLPVKVGRPSKTHHDRLLVPPNAQQSSGSDTERPPRKERRHRSHDQSNGLHRHPVDIGISSDDMPRDRSGPKQVAGFGDQSQGIGSASTSVRRPQQQQQQYPLPLHETTTSKAADHKPEAFFSPHSQSNHPTHSRGIGSGAPQFVSIRAGQGPSDPQTSHVSFKSPMYHPEVLTGSTLSRPQKVSGHDRSHKQREPAQSSMQSLPVSKNVESDQNGPMFSQTPMSPFRGLGDAAQNPPPINYQDSSRPPPAPDPPTMPRTYDVQSPGPASDHITAFRPAESLRQVEPSVFSPQRLSPKDRTLPAQPSPYLSSIDAPDQGASTMPVVNPRPSKSSRKTSFQEGHPDEMGRLRPVNTSEATASHQVSVPPQKYESVTLPGIAISKSSSSGTFANEVQSLRNLSMNANANLEQKGGRRDDVARNSPKKASPTMPQSSVLSPRREKLYDQHLTTPDDLSNAPVARNTRFPLDEDALQHGAASNVRHPSPSGQLVSSTQPPIPTPSTSMREGSHATYRQYPKSTGVPDNSPRESAMPSVTQSATLPRTMSRKVSSQNIPWRPPLLASGSYAQEAYVPSSAPATFPVIHPSQITEHSYPRSKASQPQTFILKESPKYSNPAGQLTAAQQAGSYHTQDAASSQPYTSKPKEREQLSSVISPPQPQIQAYSDQSPANGMRRQASFAHPDTPYKESVPSSSTPRSITDKPGTSNVQIYAPSSRPDEPYALPHTMTSSTTPAYPPSNVYRPPSRATYQEATPPAQSIHVTNSRTVDPTRPESRNVMHPQPIYATQPPQTNPANPHSMPISQSKYESSKRHLETATVPSRHPPSQAPPSNSSKSLPRSQLEVSSRNRGVPSSAQGFTHQGQPYLPHLPNTFSVTQPHSIPSTSNYAASSPLPAPTYPQQTTSRQNALTAAGGSQPHVSLPQKPDPTTMRVSPSHPPQGPSRVNLTRSNSNDSELLKTPSSLAPSMLKPTVSKPPPPPPSPKPSSKDSIRKKGLFGLLKSKVTSTKIRSETPTVTMQRVDHARVPPADHKQSMSTIASSTVVPSSNSRVTKKAPPPVIIPPPIITTGRKDQGSGVFSSFRFLTAKRHRTVSAASLEAQDGTATNTAIGSPTQSTVSQNPAFAPPLRDPQVAAEEWRNREEAELAGRGTGRRRRPGVVFDVAEEGPTVHHNPFDSGQPSQQRSPGR